MISCLKNTGKFIGEGFDEPRLDTLFLAMPISWKGTLQQYAGRQHRLCASKDEVQIYDYVDIHVGMLEWMYHKRLSGYASIGYMEYCCRFAGANYGSPGAGVHLLRCCRQTFALPLRFLEQPTGWMPAAVYTLENPAVFSAILCFLTPPLICRCPRRILFYVSS